jgi:hypothetical protein
VNERTMQRSWAVRLDGRDAEGAAALRLEFGIQACQSADGFWLRGIQLDDRLDRQLAKLPGGQRYAIDEHGLGIPDGCLLPTIRVPDAGWEPIAACFPLRLGTAALPGALPERLCVGLRRSGAEQPCTALVCSWEAWSCWADESPLVRLSRLRFSRCDQRALLLGEPLPPLPGIRCHVQGGLILPAGYALAPIADPELITEVFRLKRGDFALVDATGEWEMVSATAIAEAHRMSVRATSGVAGHG